MSYQRSTSSSLAGWQGPAPSSSGAAQPPGREWVPPANWRTYERRDWLPSTQAQSQGDPQTQYPGYPQAQYPAYPQTQYPEHPQTQHLEYPQTQSQGDPQTQYPYPQTQYPEYPQTQYQEYPQTQYQEYSRTQHPEYPPVQYPGSPLPPPPATMVVPTQRPVPRLAVYPATPVARPLNPAPPSPAIPLPELDEAWNATMLETPQDWTPGEQLGNTPVVGSPDQAGPSNAPLFSPVGAPPASLEPRRKAGRPKAKRKACCDNPPKSQFQRHWKYHCPNGPKEQESASLWCRWCRQVYTRKDNLKRHEGKCKKGPNHAGNT